MANGWFIFIFIFIGNVTNNMATRRDSMGAGIRARRAVCRFSELRIVSNLSFIVTVAVWWVEWKFFLWLVLDFVNAIESDDCCWFALVYIVGHSTALGYETIRNFGTDASFCEKSD